MKHRSSETRNFSCYERPRTGCVWREAQEHAPFLQDIALLDYSLLNAVNELEEPSESQLNRSIVL